MRMERRNVRLLATISEDPDVHSSIIDYAQEPLLSLVDACVPLLSLINDLSLYIQLALEATPIHPPDHLTRDESAAIRLYTMEWNNEDKSLYTVLNYTLRATAGENLKPWYKYLKLFLTGLVKLPCAPAQTVWRGVRSNISSQFTEGSAITWWAFSSSTMSLSMLQSDGYLGNTGERTLLSIEVLNGRNIRDHSWFDHEDEILLLPGTYMVVKSSLNPADDLHIIHLKQEKPNEVLLGPPFESKLNFSQS